MSTPGRPVLAPLKDDIVGRVDTMLWMLLAAVGFVLLIACANVATLLMARATSRAREFALRSALGAGRGRLTRQLVTESLVLSLTGGALGLVVAHFGVHTVATMTLFELPRAHELGVNGTVLLWTTAIACATGVTVRNRSFAAAAEAGDRRAAAAERRDRRRWAAGKGPGRRRRARRARRRPGDAIAGAAHRSGADGADDRAAGARGPGLSVIGIADHARATAGHDLRHGGEAVEVLR